MPPMSQQMSLQLSLTTTYLGGHLVRLSTAKNPRGLIPVRCKATNCLFIPAYSGKTLVQLECTEGDVKTLRDKFTWEGGQNAYGAYTSLLTQESSDGMSTPMGMDKWKMLSREDASTYGVKMTVPSSTLRFSQMEPSQFKPPESIRDSGVSTKLPRPGG